MRGPHSPLVPASPVIHIFLLTYKSRSLLIWLASQLGILFMPTKYAFTLAKTAVDLHVRFHNSDENDPDLTKEIKVMYDSLGFDFDSVEVPWSAVFISFCVKDAGAKKTEFKFAMSHSVFVHEAIKNRDAGKGVFQAFDITEAESAPDVGDIIQNNRSGNHFNFQHAREESSYESHSAIVVAKGNDEVGQFVETIGGNEDDSIRRRTVRLNKKGLVVQKAKGSYICVIKTSKA
jgi:hypothetical protein